MASILSELSNDDIPVSSIFPCLQSSIVSGKFKGATQANPFLAKTTDLLAIIFLMFSSLCLRLDRALLPIMIADIENIMIGLYRSVSH